MSDVIRYKPGDAKNNAAILLGLLDAWGNRCYVCKTPLDFADAQIDHIIPATIKPADLEVLLKKALTDEARAAGFELHSPHNLAPMCTTCNGKKSDSTFPGAGQAMLDLDLARKKQSRVEKRVKSFERSNAVSKAMLAISIADLSDPSSRNALFDLGPLVITRLRAVAPEILTAPENYDYPGDPYGLQDDGVLVTLDESSRRAKVILEDVHGIDFNSVIAEAARAIKCGIERDLISGVERNRMDEGYGDAVADGANGTMLLNITSIIYDSIDENFEMRGEYEMDGAVDVNVASVTADLGTEWVQDYVDTAGTFSVNLWPDIDSESGVSIGDPELDEADPANQ